MYTTYGTGYGKPGQTYHIGTRKYGYKPWCQEQEEKKASAGRKPHGFLNARIPSIAPDLYVEDDRDTTVNVTTKENLDFLYRSAKKYAQLLNTELPYHPKGRISIREKICRLYDALDSIVSHHVNLELVAGRLQFCINVSFSTLTCLEVMAGGVSKGHALEAVAKKLGYSLKDCIAFGDGMNDAEMLSMAGKGCIMGSAHQRLKDLHPELEVIGTNADDAVPHYLRKLYLS